MTYSNTNETQYFDLHTTGIGYLNRIREVEVRKGKPFMAVTVAALHGASDEVEYSYIDCKVSGSDAEKLVRRCKASVTAGKKVLIAFRIGDIWAEAFTYTKGDKKGETGVSLKGRLLFISWIKIDGETVYEAKPKEEKSSTGTSAAADFESSHEPESGTDFYAA